MTDGEAQNGDGQNAVEILSRAVQAIEAGDGKTLIVVQLEKIIKSFQEKIAELIEDERGKHSSIQSGEFEIKERKRKDMVVLPCLLKRLKEKRSFALGDPPEAIIADDDLRKKIEEELILLGNDEGHDFLKNGRFIREMEVAIQIERSALIEITRLRKKYEEMLDRVMEKLLSS